MIVGVRLLGRPQISTGQEPCPQPRGRKSWALLARLVFADRPLSRAELAAELFPDTDDPLGSLRWSLADLRRSLGLPNALRGDLLHFQSTDIACDVWSLNNGSLAASEIGGTLLEGAELRDCPEFDMWLLLTRSHCAARSLESLRSQALRAIAVGDTAAAVFAAERAARMDPLDETTQELFLRALVSDGKQGLATAHLAACEGRFAGQGLRLSPAVRAAATLRTAAPLGVRAGVVAEALLRAGTAALDAGAADAGVETLRRAADDAERAGDPILLAEVLRALGGALVHAVRGCDGEGAVVLHQALISARKANRPAVSADILRELAFVDVQAGRHLSAAGSLQEALDEVGGQQDDGLHAAILAIQGMNEADQGRHLTAISILTRSAALATSSGRPRQHAWSLGLLARSLLLSGQPDAALRASEQSMEAVREQRWTAFQPWPQAIRAEALLQTGEVRRATHDAEESFALGCELGDPCWEGMAARAIGMLASLAGKPDTAWEWLLDARQRADRVSDRYVWISGYIGLAQLQLAARTNPELVSELAARLYSDAGRGDLPEFLAWSLTYQSVWPRPHLISLATQSARTVDNPALHRRIDELSRGVLHV